MFATLTQTTLVRESLSKESIRSKGRFSAHVQVSVRLGGLSQGSEIPLWVLYHYAFQVQCRFIHWADFRCTKRPPLEDANKSEIGPTRILKFNV